MKCPNCHAENVDTAKYCNSCGASLIPPVASETQSAGSNSSAAASYPKRVKNTGSFLQREHPILPVVAASLSALLLCNNVLAASGTAKTTPAVDSAQTTDAVEPLPAEEIYTSTSSTDVLFADADQLAQQGIDKIQAQDYSGTELTEAINQYISIGNESGEVDAASSRISGTFDYYLQGVLAHEADLENQTVTIGLYRQNKSDLETAVAFSESIVSAGYSVDYSTVSSKLDGLRDIYREKFIYAFNGFTQEETYSRTEAWKLMGEGDIVDTDLLDTNEVDDPLTQRYFFAYAGHVEKQTEDDVANGNYADAMDRIKEALSQTDYSPLLLSDYVLYASKGGYDAYPFDSMYNDVKDTINSSQGITIGNANLDSTYDINLSSFWYFNEFDTYSVDDTNGCSPSAHQEIRSIASNYGLN